MDWIGARSIARSRWAAIGAACAAALGAGGLMTASATIDSGSKPVLISIAPCRVMDTRAGADNVGPRSTPIGPGETHSIAVRGDNGNCVGIPADAVSVVLNVAAIEPASDSFLTVFPADATRPLAANLNWRAAQPPVSNAVTVRISADGRISFFNLAGSVHVAADIVGYSVDHTHDDRYYTGAEVNALLAAKANSPVTGAQITDGSLTTGDMRIQWAQIAPDATVWDSSGGVTVTRRPGFPVGPGKFYVNFGRDVSRCAYSATQGTGVPGMFSTQGANAEWGYIEASPISGLPNVVGVYTYDTAESPVNLPFHIVVFCMRD